MYNTVIIKQPAGLGDIFFCQKIANYYIYENCNVIWPIKDSIFWVSEYLSNNGHVKYVNENDDFEYKDAYLKGTAEADTLVLKLDGSQHAMGDLIMKSKYLYAGIDWDDWAENFEFDRKFDKENTLYYDVLKLTDDEEYVFSNKYYGTPPGHLEYPYTIDTNLKVVELDITDGYTLFDWIKVIEHAKEIHMVDSGLNYIIEKIETNASIMNCYCRHGEYTKNQIEFMFNKEWNYLWN